MIASLTGIVLSSQTGQIVVEVSGVGFQVHTTPQVSSALKVGQQTSLSTTLVVREDALTLFGFLSQSDLEIFELLRSVNGVGPKSALSVLASLTAEQIAQAVATESDSTFKQVVGIGAKTAKLIVLTLAGKMKVSASGSQSRPSFESSIQGLIGLGWSEKQARDTVFEVARQEMSDKEVLKAALQVLSKGRK